MPLFDLISIVIPAIPYQFLFENLVFGVLGYAVHFTASALSTSNARKSIN
jgi:hypothetical protein